MRQPLRGKAALGAPTLATVMHRLAVTKAYQASELDRARTGEQRPQHVGMLQYRLAKELGSSSIPSFQADSKS
jgi:hypothetical protein